MKKLTILLSIAMILGHAITELATILGRKFVYLQTLMIKPFWGSKEEIAFLWYIKFMSEELLWCVTMFVLCKISYQYSFRFFTLSCVFFLYHLIDMTMFFYDFKRSYNAYMVLMIMMIAGIIALVWPYKKKCSEGNVKAMY